MRNLLYCLPILGFVLVFSACKERHFISDSEYRTQVHQKFLEQKQLVPERANDLFGVFDKNLKTEQKEALEFLYAYMPLNDLADYDGKFFKSIVEVSLKARREMPWGKVVPEDVFRHFVLPYRINNENLDTFRMAMYDELKERVKGLSMREAALEINHWCHEHVTYKGTDIRTSAPLSLMKTSWGRCGEESTFGVSALRTIGIPARQCYTPRWAHCDDNHAWIEVWVDGKWYFLGACEPEPDLNMGWFAEPARRAMLVHTRAFGAYKGDEKVVTHDEKFSELNLTSHYAPVKTFYVKVYDMDNRPAADAKVEFQLYNYAEFYPIASKNTNNDGVTHLSCGLGDLLVWAHKDNSFGYKKITVGENDTLKIVLDRTAGNIYEESFDIIPPIERVPHSVDEQGREVNNARLKKEDEIRNKYMSTFMDSMATVTFASEYDLDFGRTWKVIEKSTGNWKSIKDYLAQGSKIDKSRALDLLEVIAPKDLRDTPSETLLDHLSNSVSVKGSSLRVNENFFVDYILNPRVANELLSPYRSFFQKNFGKEFIDKARNNPNELIEWIKTNIRLDDKGNYYRTPITPIGVFKTQLSDLYSLNIFFVAACRSLGIPSRLNEATRVPEYYEGEVWKSVLFKEFKEKIVTKGNIRLSLSDKNLDPEYYIHWTLAKFDDGKFHTLEYQWNKKFSEFDKLLQVEQGNYMLVTGYRMNDGTILSNLKFFNVAKDKTTDVDLSIRKVEEKPKALGTIDLDREITLFGSGEMKNVKEILANKVGIIAWIDPDKEPTKHVMVDLAQLKEKFENWGGSFALLMDKQKVSDTFTDNFFEDIPGQCFYGFDPQLGLLEQLEKDKKQTLRSHYPVIAIVDAQGNYYFLSHGYKIGVGEQIIKTLGRLHQK